MFGVDQIVTKKNLRRFGTLAPEMCSLEHKSDSEESGGGGPPPDSLEIPDLVRYGDHQDPRDHHDPANLDKLGSNFLHHPAVMGSLEKLIRHNVVLCFDMCLCNW
ncbi:hypothetical protein B9Z55_024005 [Caenorhabditis nigoni]|uniref:Uncharacterized protein n=1 Tax=Caenorhabditis nigoni TaxID=1611254 RepID=A0A2G5ST04_9PELO|nr:hypothetical protein B9Z55_024005 [Caenorhabditis nigoni]